LVCCVVLCGFALHGVCCVVVVLLCVCLRMAGHTDSPLCLTLLPCLPSSFCHPVDLLHLRSLVSCWHRQTMKLAVQSSSESVQAKYGHIHFNQSTC
jgi:hypothetical protein